MYCPASAIVNLIGGTLVFLGMTRASVVSRLDDATALCKGIDIRELTIEGVHELYVSKKLNARALVDCYIYRIEKLNPYLKAVLEINPDAQVDADQTDFDIRQYLEIRRPLEGIPILLKDNIGTNGSMHTSAGSWALQHAKPKKDAQVVELLKKAGAIILGKANLSEFAG